MKRFLIWGLTLLLVSAFAGAATRARYRIDLRDGSHVFSRDLPVHRGTVVTFHTPDGMLTGLPEEAVLAIQSEGTATSSRTVAKTSVSTTVRTQGRAEPVLRGRVSAIETLARPLEPGEILVLGPTGSGSAQIAGQAGAAPPSIGPNGTPVLAPPGAPGSGQPATAPNGTPATGQPGTPGSAQPNTAPNGTPASPPPGGSSNPKG